ncbi:MAG: copper-binding protein [Planctomycetota bacterium]
MSRRQALTLGVLFLLTSGCSEQAATPTRTQASNGATPDNPDRYTVRGVVTELPDGGPLAEFRVQHEPIANFRNSSGEVVGMNAMVMPFPIAEGVSLDALEVGTKVELDFEVTWGDIPYQVTSLRTIDQDAVLDLTGVVERRDQDQSE